MTRTKLLGLSLLGLVVLSGCGYYPDYGYSSGPSYYYPSTPGDVSLSWSFAGAYCDQAPEVQSVWVTIPGETLENDGVYPCQIRGTSGIVLRDFYPGDYSFSLEGVGYRGERLYVGGGVFTVDGNVHLAVDLDPYGGPGGYAYLQWSFPGGDSQLATSCRAAGVDQVEVRIDGGAAKSYPCAEGTLGQGAKSAALSQGTHQIEISAAGKSGAQLYRYSGQLRVDGKEAVSAAFGLK